MVNGLVSLSGRSHPELRQLTDELRSRIASLGMAHDLVRERSQYGHGDHGLNSLRSLLDRLLAPYRHTDLQRVEILGDDAEIDDRAATPLALLFHELVTNAAKYGAFAAPDGRLEIEIVRAGDELAIEWREHGRAEREHEPGTGFGSRLISLSLETQLSGNLQREPSDDGMTIRIRIPLSSLTRPERRLS